MGWLVLYCCINLGFARHRRPPANLAELAFWLLVNAIGQLWKRFARPYSLPPLCLGRLCDSQEDFSEKQALATQFFNLPRCCQCESFTKPLLRLASSPSDLLPGGKLFGTIEATARTKITNIEVECNFARANSAKAATRGRQDHSSQLCAKHLLAEIKACHAKDLVRQANQGYMTPPVHGEALVKQSTLASSDDASVHQASKKRRNSIWTYNNTT